MILHLQLDTTGAAVGFLFVTGPGPVGPVKDTKKNNTNYYRIFSKNQSCSTGADCIEFYIMYIQAIQYNNYITNIIK